MKNGLLDLAWFDRNLKGDKTQGIKTFQVSFILI